MLKLLDDWYNIVVFRMVRNNIFMNNTRIFPLQQQLKLLRNILLVIILSISFQNDYEIIKSLQPKKKTYFECISARLHPADPGVQSVK